MARYLAYAMSIAMALLSLALALGHHPSWWWGVAGVRRAGAAGQLGHRAEAQHPAPQLSRSWPISATGWNRSGPEMRQYFIEGDTAEVPFSRQQRALVYQRAKGVNDVVPFGSQQDVYSMDYEWINHSMAPTEIESHDFRIVIGSETAQPYTASVFNISAMSFGSLSANAIRALNAGAKRGRLLPRHRRRLDLALPPRTRRRPGLGNRFRAISAAAPTTAVSARSASSPNANTPQVKMIEIKLSQGAKPGHGGVLPAAKVSAEIAATRGVPMGVDCVSPARHSAFSTPKGLLEFVARLRTLSGGKPTGFKLAIGHPWEWFGIAKAMQETAALHPELCRTSSWSTAPKAAPARRRRSSSTMSACRCTRR